MRRWRRRKLLKQRTFIKGNPGAIVASFLDGEWRQCFRLNTGVFSRRGFGVEG
jgi:hypothetical protein